MNAHAMRRRASTVSSQAHSITARFDDVRARVRHALGYRGLVLAMLGLIYICIGLAVIGAHDYMPDLPHTHLPVPVRVLIWAIPGGVAIGVAADHKWQALGFALLFIPPSERAVSYLVAALTVPTWQRVPGTLVYLLVVLTVTFMASWPEPAEVEVSVTDQLEDQHFVDLIGSDSDKFLGDDRRLHESGQAEPPEVT